MHFKDYYKILDVKPTANLKEIKTAYRKLARKYHPDVSQDNKAEEKFKEISAAYRVLKSPEQRAEYDEIREYNTDGQQFKTPPGWQAKGANKSSMDAEEFSEFFSSIFGRGFDGFSDENINVSEKQYGRRSQSGRYRGQDVQTDMPIFLEDTLSDELQTISYHLAGIEKKLKVKIPAGVVDDELIRLKGQGMPGINGGKNGDLYVRIKLIPHPLFDVEGHNLIITLPLVPWEAALGTQVELPTLKGKVKLSIPANSQNGQRLRIKGKGLINKEGGAGDLYAILNIVIPSKWSETDLEHLKELAKNTSYNPRAEWSKY